ncbi:MAG TPA: pitrilysin family protein [Stellaceae bacterium]|jgi:zinc protease|nr:pitrilysin family protein [Stellaceae bacterium]
MTIALALRSASVAAAALVALALPARAVTIEPVKSAQGVTAWLVEDHSVPVVSMSAAFRGGGALDPADKKGLATMTVDLLDEGAGDLDSTAYQSKVEDLAAQVNFSAGPDTISVRLRTLKANVAPSFDLLRLALAQPRFDPEPVARVRASILDAIAREQRQPNALASRLWWKTAFPNHPYGLSSRGTADTVNAITPDDLRGFIHNRFGKDVLIIGVVGDITPAELKPLLDSTFGSLPDHAAPDTVPDMTAQTKGEADVANMPIPQSVIVFGQPGVKRSDPDWYTALLDLDILSSGGLASRVTREVREKRGLAYSVSASLDPLVHAGVILGQAGSQNANAAQAIDVIRATWQKMHDDGPTAKELADAKTYVTGSFPLSLDSTGRIASILVSIQFDHLGIDYLDKRDQIIDSVTLADAKRVAKRLLSPDDLLFTVVGQPANLNGAVRVTPAEGLLQGVAGNGIPAEH